MEEWYANGPLGLEQGFTLARAPPGRGGPVTLALGLPATTHARLQRSADLQLGRSLRYTGLAAVDARGRPLHSWLQLSGRRLLVHVDDRTARYPVRVDPLYQSAQLTASDSAAGQLGASAAISSDGSVVAVGAPARNSNRGAVYVFVRPAGGWADESEAAILTGSDSSGGDVLGYSVAISADGSTIVAGAPDAKISTVTSAGALYVFTRGSGWASGNQNAKFQAMNPGLQAGLGCSVSVAGDGSVIVAGVCGALVGTNMNQGAVYVYQRSGATWPSSASENFVLTATGGAAQDGLGRSVGISADGGTIAGGAPGTSVGGNAGEGAAYVFTPVTIGTGWAEAAKLTESSGAAGDFLGGSLVVPNGGGSVVVGATATARDPVTVAGS